MATDQEVFEKAFGGYGTHTAYSLVYFNEYCYAEAAKDPLSPHLMGHHLNSTIASDLRNRITIENNSFNQAQVTHHKMQKVLAIRNKFYDKRKAIQRNTPAWKEFIQV